MYPFHFVNPVLSFYRMYLSACNRKRNCKFYAIHTYDFKEWGHAIGSVASLTGGSRENPQHFEHRFSCFGELVSLPDDEGRTCRSGRGGYGQGSSCSSLS